jgi:hypothetical protein
MTEQSNDPNPIDPNIRELAAKAAEARELADAAFAEIGRIHDRARAALEELDETKPRSTLGAYEIVDRLATLAYETDAALDAEKIKVANLGIEQGALNRELAIQNSRLAEIDRDAAAALKQIDEDVDEEMNETFQKSATRRVKRLAAMAVGRDANLREVEGALKGWKREATRLEKELEEARKEGTVRSSFASEQEVRKVLLDALKGLTNAPSAITEGPVFHVAEQAARELLSLDKILADLRTAYSTLGRDMRTAEERITADSYTIKRIHDVTREALEKIGENVPDEPLVPAVERLAGLAVSAEEQLAETRRKIERLDLDARDLRVELEQARDLDTPLDLVETVDKAEADEIRDVIVEAVRFTGMDPPLSASISDLVDHAATQLVRQHKDLATLREQLATTMKVLDATCEQLRTSQSTNGTDDELAETRKVLAEILEDLGGNPADLATARTPEVANTLGVKIADALNADMERKDQLMRDLHAARAELARVRSDRELIRIHADGNGRELAELKVAHKTLSDLYVRARGDLAHAHEELARLHAQVAKHEDRGLALVQEAARQAERDARVARAEADAAEAEAQAMDLRDEAHGLRWMLTERTEELVKLRVEVDAKRVEVQAPGGAS